MTRLAAPAGHRCLWNHSVIATANTAPLRCRYAELSTPPLNSTKWPPTWKWTFITQRSHFSTSLRQRAEIIIKVPEMAESITEGTLSTFLKNVGDHLEQDDELASIETDKIDVSINAPEGGVIAEFFVKEGDVVTVGQQIARIDTEAQPSAQEDASAESPQDLKSSNSGPAAEISTASEEIAIQQPETSNTEIQNPLPKNEQKRQPEANKETNVIQKKPSGTPTGEKSRMETRVKMSRMRMKISERLKQSQNTAASLTTFNEVDMSAIMNLRRKYKDGILEKHGVRFGFMSAFAKAATLALQEVPAVNAAIEGPGSGDTIVFREYVDISIAVSTPKGLVTPVLRNCESLSMIEMEKSIAAMAEKARASKITMEDLAGGNFTISNGGVFGSMMGTPIINLPQTAVLGLHGIKDRPAVVDGKIEIRPMMYLALTYDHRLLDGKEASTFLGAVKKYIEDPSYMLVA